jgi:hypothetical protein
VKPPGTAFPAYGSGGLAVFRGAEGARTVGLICLAGIGVVVVARIKNFCDTTDMAYIRRRTTKAGSISTALVASYRDKQGRPRQRLLANLHGEPDVLKALAKLASLRDALRKKKEALAAEAIEADKFYEIVTQNTLHGHRYSTSERKEIDRLMRQRELLLKRLRKIERDLVVIQRDGAVIKRDCTASPAEIQAAIRVHKQERHDAEALALGLQFAHQQQIRDAKAALRRLST